MLYVSRHSDSIASLLTAESHSSLPNISAQGTFSSQPSEQVVSQWLTQLLEHFSLHKLDATSNQELADHLADFIKENAANLQYDNQSDELIAALRRRVMRLAGARLDDAFVSMTPDIVDEADVVPTFLSTEGQELEGVCYRKEVYRKLEEFQPCHRLQSYCLAQTLSERQISYMMTRSPQRFAVWVNVCAISEYGRI